MEHLSNSAICNLFLSGDEALDKAKKNCIELLDYRIKHQLDVVIDAAQKVWRLVLHDSVNNEDNSLNATSYDGTICSGYGDVPQGISDMQKGFSVRLSVDLVLVKLQKEANEIYYVLSDSGEKDKVMDATSTTELECYGRILGISNGQDPPEAISCKIVERYFLDNKKYCPSIHNRHIEMIRNGDVQTLKKEVVDIKCTNTENGWTMLHHAAYYGNLKIVSLLTSMGCHVHAQDDICARKPVHIAAREGHTDVIEFFLLHGLSVNEADQIGWTLLHYAVWKGNLEAVRFLIQKKAEVNVKDKCKGKTPIYVATEEGHLEVIELLFSSGSNIEGKANEGKTLLHVAAFKGYTSVVKFLVDNGANLDAAHKNGYRPLHFAAGEGHLDIVELLVDKAANLDPGDEDDTTPLHLAADKGHLNIAKFLVDRRANINAEDNMRWTPLGFAVQEGHLDIVEFLVDKGANLNDEEDSWTPLHCAADEGHLDIVEFLVDKEANINAGDEDGLTPLHLATIKGHLTIVKFLVYKGANLNASDKDSWTPLHSATYKGHLNIVKFLVDRGANLNAVDKTGWTPLHSAADKDYFDIVDFLVGKGANLNIVVEDGWTPLHCAANKGHLNTVEFLVDRGANINAINNQGKTPLHCGVKNIKVASYLADKMLNIFQNQGKFEDALKFYREFLQLQKKEFGHVHPETLTTHRKISEMLYDQCQYSEALDILNDTPHSERDLCSNYFITLRYKCELRLLISEVKINCNDAMEVLKEVFNIQEVGLSTNHCQESTTLIPEQDETVEMVKEVINEKEPDLDTNHCIKFQEPTSLIPEEDEIIEMVKEDTNEKKAEVGNVNGKHQIAKKRFERKASGFFKNGKGIHGCMIFFWLFSIICLCAIFCFQQHYFKV